MRASSYPNYQLECGWNALLPARKGNAALTSDTDCDVAIIGAGYTGLAAARRCAELQPEATIAVLDSSRIGEGNPGRNSGFMLEIALANDAEPEQLERMTACNRLIGDAMAGLKVKGTLFGKLLADIAFGRETPDVPALFGRASWMPPEPLRRLGFGILSGIESRRGRAEL